MSFYAIEIEGCPGYTFNGGPTFSTNIQDLANGNEKRNGDWAVCRHKYTAPFANIHEDVYLAIKAVFLICRGRLHTFLFKDWGDFEAQDEAFGTGDGATKIFQLKKISTLAGTSATYERIITKPVAGATFKVNGVATGAALDVNTGLVTFAAAPALHAALTWSGEFRVQVRFDNDELPFSLDSKFGAGDFANNGSIDLLEVLNELEDAT
jgi:uncharacterized protein (TIGR02217 family)